MVVVVRVCARMFVCVQGVCMDQGVCMEKGRVSDSVILCITQDRISIQILLSRRQTLMILHIDFPSSNPLRWTSWIWFDRNVVTRPHGRQVSAMFKTALSCTTLLRRSLIVRCAQMSCWPEPPASHTFGDTCCDWSGGGVCAKSWEHAQVFASGRKVDER